MLWSREQLGKVGVASAYTTISSVSKMSSDFKELGWQQIAVNPALTELMLTIV